MIKYTTRPARPEDADQLRYLWKVSFGDSDEYIDAFTRALTSPAMTVVYEELGSIVSAAYVVELGEFVHPHGERIPCRNVYAFSTLPDHRGWGIGSTVIRRAAALSQEEGGAGVICPASYSLFRYYRRAAGYRDYFYMNQFSGSASGLKLRGSAVRISPAAYSSLRRRLLEGRAHIDFSQKAMDFQAELCNKSGGGLFQVNVGGATCAAAAEIAGGELIIKELLCPQGSPLIPAALTARALGKEGFTCRTPVKPGEECLPFAMASGIPEELDDVDGSDSGLAWYGFAFD